MQNKMTLKFCLIPVRLIFIRKSRTKKDKRNISSCLFPHSTCKKWSRALKKLPDSSWHTSNTDRRVYTSLCDAGRATRLRESPGCGAEKLPLSENPEIVGRVLGRPCPFWTGCGERGALIHCFWEWVPVKALWKPAWSLWNYRVTQMQPSRASTHELPCSLLHYPP